MSYWLAVAFKTVNPEELAKELQAVAEIGPVRVFYWLEYRLLGISTTDMLPEYQFVEFQNGTDQDYDSKTWPNLPLFQKVIEEVGALSYPKVLEELSWDEEEDDKSIEEYARRTLMYSRIYSLLDLESWEMDRESKAYSTFSIKGLL